MASNNSTEVRVGADKGRLRLRWSYQGRNYCLYLKLDDTKANRVKAKDIQLLIEADIETGCFDSTLAKYKPHQETGKQISEISVGELFNDWLKYKATYCDKLTIKYRGYVRNNLITYFKERKARDITKRDGIEFLAWLKDTYNIKPDTIKRKLQTIKACWDWAIDNSYLTDNPWVGIPKLVKPTSRPKPKPFTLDEIERIIEGFSSHRKYNELLPFVRFLFGTGVRTGEAIGLRWSDLTPDCSECTISEQLTSGTRKGTKTGRVRTLKLSPSIQQMLVELKAKSKKLSQDSLVFTWNGRPIDNRNFRNRAWKKILASVGVPYRKLYSTRHTFISHCLEKGMNPVAIAQITGHDVNVLFNHYAGALKEPELPDLGI